MLQSRRRGAAPVHTGGLAAADPRPALEQAHPRVALGAGFAASLDKHSCTHPLKAVGRIHGTLAGGVSAPGGEGAHDMLRCGLGAAGDGGFGGRAGSWLVSAAPDRCHEAELPTGTDQ